jgi:DICT domain-containing protein
MTTTGAPLVAAMSSQRRTQLRKNAERLLQTGTVAQQVAAQSTLDELDRLASHEEQQRRASVASMNIPERVANAFTSLPPTETEQNLLQVLLDNPHETSQALSSKLGWRGQSWHLHFGTMCQKREALLWAAEPAVVRDALFYCGMLADCSKGDSRFTMKPDVAEGLGLIGIKPVRP